MTNHWYQIFKLKKNLLPREVLFVQRIQKTDEKVEMFNILFQTMGNTKKALRQAPTKILEIICPQELKSLNILIDTTLRCKRHVEEPSN